MSSLSSSGIIISSTGSYFSILPSFHLVTASETLFPINSPVLWTIYLEAVFRTSNPVSNNCFLYFLVDKKNLYLLTYFLVLCSIEYRRIVKLEERVISIY